MGRKTVLAFIAALALVLSACSGTVETSASGPTEGIQVHGDWVIDVYNADGTLDRHIAFENALTGDGEAFLATVLGRTASVGEWTVRLDDTTATADVCGTLGSPGKCFISQTITGAGRFTNLLVTVDGSTVVLSGSATASNDGKINRVATFLGGCGPTVPTDTCVSDPTFTTASFTGANVGDFLISAGQQVQVEVTLSFS